MSTNRSFSSFSQSRRRRHRYLVNPPLLEVSRSLYNPGTEYSDHVDLAAFERLSQRFELPDKIFYKVCCLVQIGRLPRDLDESFFELLVSTQRVDITYVEHALEKLYYLKERCYDPVAWLVEQYRKYVTDKEQPVSPAIRLDDGLVYIHKVKVTPTRVYFCGPEIFVSNRVLRRYRGVIDNFLCVSFIDENGDKMCSTDLSSKVAVGDENRRIELYERILSTIREGIRIRNKKFEFLAYSSSQLRDNSLWMFAPTDDLCAKDIRYFFGNFGFIKNVAKYASTLGEPFDSSIGTLCVNPSREIKLIPDIAPERGEVTYNFSDGIGKISAKVAREVARKCGLESYTPSAFRIRYGGYKGVVAVDPSSSAKLSLRLSMRKYQSDHMQIDVLSWSKYQPCFLNRQIIVLLSTLGIHDDIFVKKQRESVAQLNDMVDRFSAQKALELMSSVENTHILQVMLQCGYEPNREPFLSMMLQTFRASILLDLRVDSKIFIPQGRQMMGCLDETGTLEYGQVFVQFSDNSVMMTTEIVKGKVVVAKNRSLHPGDLRVLEGIDVPKLHHTVDCIVFPQKGIRPHPNECSGSDLNGDVFFVCWDPDLIPRTQVEPMDYRAAPTKELDHKVAVEEVEEYFVNNIGNDSLKIIADAHMVFADKEQSMALSEPCLELARLFYLNKMGITTEIPPHLHVKEYPDFMEKPDESTYVSTCIIGKLFREMEGIALHNSFFEFKSFTKEDAGRWYDHEMEVDGFVDHIREAFLLKMEYDFKLGNLMEYYGIKTEAEILSEGIMKDFDRRNAIGAAVRSLMNEARVWVNMGTDRVNAMASAQYHVTYHPDFWGRCKGGLERDHYLSFAWCVYDKLVQIKKDKSSMG